MKMLMLDTARKSGSDRSGGHMGYPESNYARMGYDGAESGYAGMEMGMEDMESRRRRDSRGRFRSEMGGMEDTYSEMENRNGYGRSEMGSREMRSGMRGYPSRPFPVYEGGGKMNQIGFRAGPEMDGNYWMDAGYHGGDEMEYRSSPMHMGRGESVPRLTRESAEEWAKGMENEDGTKGPHWTMDQAKQVMVQRGINLDPFQFWIAMNAMYSDYGKVFKKHGVGDKIDLYVDLAKAFIEDKDAQPEKLARYYEYVVKH